MMMEISLMVMDVVLIVELNLVIGAIAEFQELFLTVKLSQVLQSPLLLHTVEIRSLKLVNNAMMETMI